ncbi:MAG: biosynthetic-type acetolactate synthase large subunit [Candidatus Delongbacteria bacterium]|nr:biosynthetic-type acetolactate synthase large subunit [Candidatus Delongbacteria bacterium]
MKMRGTKIVIESLLREGVDTIFGYPGGQVIPLFDELYNYTSKLQLIIPRHEQGGTHAADGYARSTGKVGVMVATSGPGATNTVTGIATAYMDSIPLVIITGQVPISMIGTDAFQEADITGITLPITKAGFLVYHVEELASTLKTAFDIARSGRPGPVLVDIPLDIQKAEYQFEFPDKIELAKYEPKEYEHPKQIKNAFQLIMDSKRPLVLAGGGIIQSNSTPALHQFLEGYGIPVVHTMMGHGIYPADPDLYYGTVGMHGSVYANHAIQSCDLLIALGVRFSDRILGNIKSFAPKARIIHVDIDAAEIGKNVRANYPIIVHIQSFLNEMNKLNKGKLDTGEWIGELKAMRQNHPFHYNRDGLLKPQYVIELLTRYFPDDTIVVTDVGQNQIWTSQYYTFKHPRCWLSSGGLGTMGFALPAAIGAKIANPDREVLMIAGDGGFQMNIQELMTVQRYGLIIKMVVLDNNCLGMVRQWQQAFYNKRYSGTCMTDNPNFAEIACSMGIKGIELDRNEQAEEKVKELVQADHSILLHARIDPNENVLPMVPVGTSLSNPLTTI